MSEPTVAEATETIYASLRADNADIDAHIATLKAALAESDDLRNLISSPIVSRGEAAKAVAAAATVMGLDPLTTKFLGVLAQNRRLAKLGDVIRAFNRLTAAHRGETTAEVTSAHPLSASQVKALKAKLKTQLARDVAVDLTVDPSILGGLIVKIGSRQIDSSIRSKLNTLAIAMKG